MNRAQLLDRYNTLARKLGRKELKSFKDLPTAKARTAEIEAEAAKLESPKGERGGLNHVEVVKNSPLKQRLSMYGITDDTKVRVKVTHLLHSKGTKVQVARDMIGFEGTLGQWKKKALADKDVAPGTYVWVMAHWVRNGVTLLGFPVVEFQNADGKWAYFNEKGKEVLA